MELINLTAAISESAKIKKKNKKNLKNIKIAFLRDYTVERIIPYLEYFLLKEGFLPKFYFSDFDNIFQDIVNHESKYYKFAPDITIIAQSTNSINEKLTNNFIEAMEKNLDAEIKNNLSELENIFSHLYKKKVGTVLIHNFETPKFAAMGILDYQSINYQINVFRKLNLQLARICEKYKDIHIVDIDFLQRFYGVEKSFDNRYWHLEKNPYTQNYLQHISKEYLKFVKAIKGKTKKSLILDLDNTLYGGILGEDGFEGIKIGQTYPGSAFKNFQKTILGFYNRGVVLGLCTKNNFEDVMEILEKHPDMVLRAKHFSVIKANWDDKASNIQNISEELNIGLDSLVFVDDNPFEINLVKSRLPEVTAVQLPDDPVFYSDTLNELGCFDNLNFSFEDKKRTKMYQAEVKRKKLKVKFNNISDYLSTLNMNLEIKKNDKFVAPRIAQLCQRTNQFNLTTKRYTEGDIKKFIKNKNADVFSVRLKDKFGDMGIIGAAIVKYKEEKAEIDSFILSCRSLGRGVENAFLYYCLSKIKKRGCKLVNGYYNKTKKNKQVEEFFDKRGFKLVGKTSFEKKFAFNIAKHPINKSPKYFNISS